MSKKVITNKHHKYYRSLYIFLLIYILLAIRFPDNLIVNIFNIPVLFIGAVSIPFLIFQLMVFPFDYSIIGKYKRSTAPIEKPLASSNFFYGGAGRFVCSAAFTWRLYSNGFEVSIFFLGKVFIPFENIVGIKKRKMFGYILEHDCSQVRNPIYFSSHYLFNKLTEIQSSTERKNV